MKFDLETILLSFATIIGMLGLCLLYHAAFASNKITYCYIEEIDNSYHSPYPYTLYGNVEFRQDIIISQSNSFEELLIRANKLHCKLWSEPK